MNIFLLAKCTRRGELVPMKPAVLIVVSYVPILSQHTKDACSTEKCSGGFTFDPNVALW